VVRKWTALLLAFQVFSWGLLAQAYTCFCESVVEQAEIEACCSHAESQPLDRAEQISACTSCLCCFARESADEPFLPVLSSGQSPVQAKAAMMPADQPPLPTDFEETPAPLSDSGILLTTFLSRPALSVWLL
jgi:hypothetical protein